MVPPVPVNLDLEGISFHRDVYHLRGPKSRGIPLRACETLELSL